MTTEDAQKVPAPLGPVERMVRPPAGAWHDDEETRLKVAHYRSQFLFMATWASNCANSRSADPADWRADLEAMVESAQRFLAA